MQGVSRAIPIYCFFAIFENLDEFKITHKEQGVNPHFQASALIARPMESKKDRAKALPCLAGS